MSQPFIVVVLISLLFAADQLSQRDSDAAAKLIAASSDARQTGQYQRARELLTQAIDQFEKRDTTNLQLVETELTLAELLFELGEYANCERICLDSINAIEKQHGNDHVLIAVAEKILTRLYIELEMAVLADQHGRRGLKIVQRGHGESHWNEAEFHALMSRVNQLQTELGDNGGSYKAIEILTKPCLQPCHESESHRGSDAF